MMVSRLALGAAQFGFPYGVSNNNGQVSLSSAKAMLKLAQEKGIDTIDTAIAYGDSESNLGKIGVQDFKLVTKLPAIPDSCLNVEAWVKEQFVASISRLGVSSVYGLLLHRPEQLIGVHGKRLYEAIRKLKETGLVDKFGISIYSVSELDLLVPLFSIDIIQAPFNIIDRRLYTSGWLSKLKETGIEVHTRSAFLQGLLLMPKTTIPTHFSPWAELLDNWHQWLLKNDVSALQTCLKFPLAFPEVDKVVVGAESPSQLIEIMNAENSDFNLDFPDTFSEDESFINPANWTKL